jgi:hypothetical protein
MKENELEREEMELKMIILSRVSVTKDAGLDRQFCWRRSHVV